MDGIGSVGTSATQAVGALQAAQANRATGTAQTQAALPSLPPVNLAQAASANAVEADLIASQWGIDPATVSGVNSGAGASGGLFAGDALLPLLANLSHATAEQALALIGVKTPAAAGGGANSRAAVSPTASATSPSPETQAASTPGGPMVVDPLWGGTV